MMVILQYLLLAAGIALLAWGYRHNLRNRMLGGALVLFLAGIAPDLADGFGAGVRQSFGYHPGGEAPAARPGPAPAAGG